MQDSWEPGGEPSEAERIALAALEVAKGARAAFVVSRCAGDRALAAAVGELLEDFTRSDTWLRQVATRSGALLEMADAGEGPDGVGPSGGGRQDEVNRESSEPVPTALGPYRVLETLGRGGMGAVYLAEREDREFRMRVAVKVLHAHLASRPFRSRFLSEQRILARLSHPGIARLIDGGVLDDGTPYLVMEFVEGEDLVTWANARNLGLRARVELFQQVCRAVAYAHRNLVVHRDLKPSNTRVTAEGEVKLLDFGIARVLDSVDEDVDEITRLHPFSGLPLTPRYASPEQMRGEAIGTPSDVYSMGILLRNLLRSPGDEAGPGGESGSAGGAGAGSVPGVPPPPPLPTGLPDDLAAILGKAARPEPEARYGSAVELGEDLARFLDGRPVLARAGSTRYLMRKLVTRHRWAAAAAGIALLAVLGGAAGLVVHSERVEVERDLAQLEAERAEAVTAFLVDLFDVAGDGTPMDTIRAGTLLRVGEERLRERLDPHPDVRASLLLALSWANERLGVPGAPERLLEERVEVLRDHHGPDDVAVAEALVTAAGRRVGSRHWSQAEPLLQEGLRILELHAARQPLEPGDRRRQAGALRNLAITLRHLERPDSAVAVGRVAMALDREAAARDEALIPALNALASALRGAGELEGAEALLREALEVLEGAVDPHPRNRSLILNNLASLLRLQGEMEEAEAHFRAALEAERGFSGDDSNATETLASNLTDLLVAMERFDEADALAMAWDSIIQATHPPDHWRIGRARLRRAYVWVDAGECGRALPLIREGAEIYTRALGGEHVWTVQSHVRLAECLVALGRSAEAEPLLSGALPIMLAASNPNTNFIELAAELLSAIHLAEGRVDEAERVRVLAAGG